VVYKDGKAFSLRPIAREVMILIKNDELVSRQACRGGAVTAMAEGNIFTAMDESFSIGFGKLVQPSEVLVVFESILVQENIESVVKIVHPLGVEAIAAHFGRLHNARAVKIGLSDQIEGPA